MRFDRRQCRVRSEEEHLNERIDFKNCYVRQFRNEPAVERALVQAFFAGKLGFYVDVGANDPVLDSQSWHLEQIGWTGILVEPDPDHCKQLRVERTGRVVEKACSSPANAGHQLLLKRAGPHSTVEAQPIARGAPTTSDTVAVDCETLDNILESEGVVPGFDLLSVDIEGHELPALSGFTFAKWRPRLILLEDHVVNLAKHSLMRRNGYQLLLRTGLNSWYVPESSGFTHSLAARLEFVRKYYLGLPLRKLRFSR
jgi:FkbM family methyltransferase